VTVSVTCMCLERYDREACKNDSNILSVISISGGQLNTQYKCMIKLTDMLTTHTIKHYYHHHHHPLTVEG